MRSAALASTLFGLLVTSAFAQVSQPNSLQPTRFEAFANQSAARVIWSHEVWRVESTEARVVVTALVIGGSTQRPREMRGIRIDLTKEKAEDQVYLDQTKLEVTRRALKEIARAIPSFSREPADSPYRYRGAEEFWHPYPTLHTLNAAYYIAPDSSGLSLSAYKGQEFRFPGRSPAELADAIARAINELKQR